MKKTFLARRNALLSSGDISWGAFALLFAVLALCVRLIAPNVFWYAVSPAFMVSDAISDATHSVFSSFGDAATLARYNETLIQENALLESENAALRKRAADLSGFSDSAAQGVRAGVMSRPPESPYDTLLVAAGSEQGVTVGMGAFGARSDSAGPGVPLGVVAQVGKRHARIVLFSAPHMRVNGWIGSKNVPVTLRGEGAGAFTATLSRSAQIQSGDLVYLSGPGMLPVGLVARVDSDPSSPSVALRISPLINLFATGWVELRDIGFGLRSSYEVATSTP